MRSHPLAAIAVAVALSGLALPSSAQPAAVPQPNSTPVQVPTPSPAVLPAVPQIAPGYAAPANAPLPSADLVGVAQQPFVGIKLEDALTMALQRNTDLAVAESNNRIANYQIVAAEGAYDVQFQLAPQYAKSTTAALSPFQGGPNGGPVTQISQGATAAFTELTSAGTRYSVSATATSINNNALFNAYNPFYETAINLQVTQPLLRGAGAGSSATRQLQLARAGAEAQQGAILAQASQTITSVSNTYWDLVAAWRNVGIQEEGLRNAEAQAASNGRLAQQGAAAPVEVVESNTQINVFQDNVFAALQQVESLQSQLKSLILASPGDPVWTANLVPTSAVLQLPPEPKLDDLVVAALRNRPEVRQLRAQRLQATVNLAYAKNQLLPQLDLGLGFTTNGFAGVPTDVSGTPFFQTLSNEVTAINALIARANAGQPPANQIPQLAANFGAAAPGYQSGQFGQSWSNALNGYFPAYSIQLTLQFPLRNRTAKADYSIAQEQAKQVAVQELGFLQRIRAEAANALQTLHTTQSRLAAARAAREAAQTVLASEQRKFGAGASTTFLILQRQLDAANDEGRELQAQTDLNKAVVLLEQVAGTNFAAYRIDAAALGVQTLDAQTPTASALPSPAAVPTPLPPARR